MYPPTSLTFCVCLLISCSPLHLYIDQKNVYTASLHNKLAAFSFTFLLPLSCEASEKAPAERQLPFFNRLRCAILYRVRGLGILYRARGLVICVCRGGRGERWPHGSFAALRRGQ
jgi:hypothetical protein